MQYAQQVYVYSTSTHIVYIQDVYIVCIVGVRGRYRKVYIYRICRAYIICCVYSMHRICIQYAQQVYIYSTSTHIVYIQDVYIVCIVGVCSILYVYSYYICTRRYIQGCVVYYVYTRTIYIYLQAYIVHYMYTRTVYILGRYIQYMYYIYIVAIYILCIYSQVYIVVLCVYSQQVYIV